jgi:hypothetical protein
VGAIPDEHHFIHEALGLPARQVSSAWHPALRFDDYTCAPLAYTETCAVTAMAEGLAVPPDRVWQALVAHCPREALHALLPEPGLDERAFHVAHVVFQRRAVLEHGTNTVRVVGRSGGPALTYTLADRHWRFTGAERARPPPALNRVPTTPVLDTFLAAMEAFRSPDGARVLGTWLPAPTRPDAAKPYLRELKSGVTGTILRDRANFAPDFLRVVDACLDLAQPRQVAFRAIPGFAGCGKSAPLGAFLRSRPDLAAAMVWMTASPRQTIMQDWRARVPLGRLAWLHSTYELALRRQARVLILDEATLLPPGYLELFLALRPTISHVIILGDPAQCRYHNPSTDSQLNVEPLDTDRRFGVGEDYCLWTHRLPRAVAGPLGIDTTNPEEGQVLIRHNVSRRWPVTCLSDSDQKMLSRLGLDCRTVSSRQGDECHTLQVLIGKAALTVASRGTLLSAFTRVTHRLVLVLNVAPADLDSLPLPPVLAALIGRRPPLDFLGEFADELAGMRPRRLPPDQLEAIRAARAPQRASGRGAPDWRDRVTPALQPLMHLEPALGALAPPVPPIPALPPLAPMRTHLPRADPVALAEMASEGLRPREVRELVGASGWSRLFVEQPGDWMQTKAWFPHQQASDDVLFWATVRKRLRRGTPEHNRADYAAKQTQAMLLFGWFLEYFDLPRDPVPFDRELFNDCIIENEFVKLTKKTRAQLLNNQRRADPHWKLNLTEHFVKSQLKAKAETLARDGKPGQTIALCHDAVVLLFGPMVRYLRRQVFGRAPLNRYVHCGRTIDDLSNWCRLPGHEFESETTTNDFTGFDSTQRGDSVGLEYRAMRHFNLQEAWVALFDWYRDQCQTVPDLYLDWKLTVESDLIGPKETGRDTGEPGTYDFNTWFNAAITQGKYDLPRTVASALGGDDGAQNRRLTECARWRRVGHLFEVIAKTEHPRRAEFCGYFLCPDGAYRNPKLLALKTLWHIHHGDAETVDVNYAAEALTAYRLGDRLHRWASFEELECLGWLLEYYHQERPALARHFFGAAAGRAALAAPPPPAWQLEGLTPRARRTLAAQLVAAGASRAVKGLSGAILNYYTTADHKIRPEILPTLA